MMSNQTIRQFLSGLSLIIIFISLTNTSIDEWIAKYPYWFLAGGILLFVFDKQISEKIKKE